MTTKLEPRLCSTILAMLCACASEPGGAEHGAGGSDGATEPAGGSDAGSEGDASESGAPGDDSTGTVPDACSVPGDGIAVLYPDAAPAEPIVTVREDGVVVTRAAGRVRGRHELEGTYNPFGERYFENRSYGFVIEDHVAAGEDRIDISYYPEAPVSSFGATTNLRVWKIYGDGNVFHTNLSLDTVDLQHQTKTVTGNPRDGRPMQVGDTMELEFGIFIAGNDPGDPGAIEGRTAYYTDTFRYRVGEGGLHARNDDPSGVLGPAHEAMLADATSIPYVQTQDELQWAWSQMALDMQPEHVQSFLEGRRLFHTDFGTGEHSEAGNPPLESLAGLLGPMFNVASCESCHPHDGRGSAPVVGESLSTVAVKLYGDDVLGDQLQPQEAELTLAQWELHEVELDDGTTVELRKPIYAGADPSWAYSPRIARQLTGLGLLEAIDEGDILARAFADDCQDGGGITGRASVVEDPQDGTPRLGRFGWKAEKLSVRHQIADALAQDIGVTTTMLPDGGAAELPDEELERLVAYVALLGLPGRRDADDAAVVRGEALFEQTCSGCHVTSATTGATHPFVELRGQSIRPFTDLLLHDLGEGLADPQGGPLASEWRTAPLWSIGLVDDVHGETALLHDGRARSFLEAILWHGGEAAFASETVRQMPTEDREALLAFLGSL